MRRRNLIFGLVAVAAVGTARAQQSGKVHRIAVVHPLAPAGHARRDELLPDYSRDFHRRGSRSGHGTVVRAIVVIYQELCR